MAATLLDGKALLDAVKDDLRVRIKRLAEHGVMPGLGTVLVGDDPPSHAYVRLKREDSAEIGINSVHTELPATTTQDELLGVIRRYNDDPDGRRVPRPGPAARRTSTRRRPCSPSIPRRTPTGCIR